MFNSKHFFHRYFVQGHASESAFTPKIGARISPFAFGDSDEDFITVMAWTLRKIT